MASCFSRYPSLRSMNVSELLLYFQTPIDREVMKALEEKEADWSTEKDVLRAHCRKLDLESCDLLHKVHCLEEELSKQTCMRKSLEEEFHRLAEKERWSQRKVRALEMDVLDLRRADSEELVRVQNEKADLEMKLLEFERQHVQQRDLVQSIDVLKKENGDFEHVLVKSEKEEQIDSIFNDKSKIQQLLRRIQFLEREKKEFQAKVCNMKKKKSAGIQRRSEEKDKMQVEELHEKIEVLEKEKMTLEVENRRIEEEMKEKISQLATKNEGLEMQKGGIEAKLSKTVKEKIALRGLKTRMEAELKEKISELVNRIGDLEKEKGENEAESLETIRVKDAEIESIKKVKIALEVEKSRAEDCVKVLEKGKTALEAEFSKYKTERRLAVKEKNKLIKKITQEKTALEDEKRKLEEESDEKISELVKRTEVLVRERDDMEAELCIAKKHKPNESERISKLKEALEDQKRRMEEAEKHVSEIRKTIGVLERDKKATDAEDKETSEEIKRILKEKMDLEDEKRTMDDKHNKKVLELFQKIKVLKREEVETGARFFQTNKEKDEEMKRILKEKMDLDAEMRTLKAEDKKKISELLHMIEVLKREKMEMETKFYQASTVQNEELERILDENTTMKAEKKAQEEDAKKFLEIADRIGFLEKEKWGLEEEIMHKGEEMKSILKEKMDLEAEMRSLKAEDEKKILELCHMIEVLKREKMEMETKFNEASTVQTEELKRILNENIAMKAEKKASEEDAKKFLEIANRIGILEKEKWRLEEEIMQKDEVIQVLAQENESLEDMKKKLKMEINELASKLKKTVKLVQPVHHHPSNVDLLRTPLQNEGQILVDVCKRKRTNAGGRKPKRHLSEDLCGGRISDIGNSSRHVSENLASCCRKKPSSVWNAEQDLLDAFDGDHELCLEAVCALYRQHKSLLSSKPTNTSLPLGARGLKPDYTSKVIALAEYLIDEDPEGRMKKSVAELEQLDPSAVGECIDIAKQHYKQVFEMYKNKEDPLFLS